MIEVINNKASRATLKYMIDQLPDGVDYTVTIEPKKKQRTLTQNRALHLWCECVAIAFNTSGITKRQVFNSMKKGFEVEWTKDGVKEDIFKPIMLAVTSKKSTTELTTKEVSELVDVINDNFLSDRFNGLRVEFPSEIS